MGAHPDNTIEVVAYSGAWPRRFDSERAALDRALGPVTVSIEHIGSTAVPGMSSKPTIDILVVVADVEAFVEQVGAVEALGYEWRPGNAFVGRPDHLFLRKVVDGKRTHHLHVLHQDSAEIADYRLFRDALRTDPALAARYEEVKLGLAAAHADDRMRYVTEKERWVGRELAELRASRPAG